ncbi:MAG: hypothetical protein HGB35_00665 [Geobacteraceae bacterium]|nr:hypothetical protein [Geobacteraceae bacterium]
MKILLYGSREFSLVVAELVRHCGHTVSGMVDDYNSGTDILGGIDTVIYSHPPSDYGIALAIGYSDIKARWIAWERIQSAGYYSPPLIHPRAYVADTAQVGQGTMVMAGGIIDIRVKIGSINVLWPGVCINHDTTLGSNSFVSPGVTICGFVNVGSHCFIGAGSVIVDHCTVPEASYIKMHSRYIS